MSSHDVVNVCWLEKTVGVCVGRKQCRQGWTGESGEGEELVRRGNQNGRRATWRAVIKASPRASYNRSARECKQQDDGSRVQSSHCSCAGRRTSPRDVWGTDRNNININNKSSTRRPLRRKRTSVGPEIAGGRAWCDVSTCACRRNVHTPGCLKCVSGLAACMQAPCVLPPGSTAVEFDCLVNTAAPIKGRVTIRSEGRPCRAMNTAVKSFRLGCSGDGAEFSALQSAIGLF